MVLTGGASQQVCRKLRGVSWRNVQIDYPLGVAGLPEAAKEAAFSAVGLLIYPQLATFESESFLTAVCVSS